MFRFANPTFCRLHPRARRALDEAAGSAVLEFAITLPLLVVFVVGIYDFSGAFNQKQKIEQAAQEGAIVGGALPTSDLSLEPESGSATNPGSLQAVVAAVFNSLAGSGVLTQANQGSCTLPPPPPAQSALTWTYTITGCSGSFPGDNLVISINRGWACSSGPACGSASTVAVGTNVQVAYPYHWRFNSVIQLLIPGANYAAITNLQEAATVHNQM